MKPVIRASKTSIVKNSKFDAEEVVIEDGAQVTNVEIKARKIMIKSKATLTDCKIFSDGMVMIGKESVIKERVIINAFKSITIGNRTIIDRDVMIGGMQSEKSEIVIGDDCVILYRSYLNTTCKIAIGNNVGIGGYCLIFTHSSWQNVLHGNPYKFADVQIKDDAWLPWNVTVLPGVAIENNVTVGTGSVITKNLPPNIFAAGIPARVIQKKDIRKITIKQKSAIMSDIFSDFSAYARNFLKLKILDSNIYGNYVIEHKKHRLVFSPDCKKIQKKDIIVSFTIPNQIKQNHQWIELDSLISKSNNELAKHFITFVRRYGIKIK